MTEKVNSDSRWAKYTYSINFYQMEVRQFEWDVHILILGSLQSGLKALGTQIAKDSEHIKGKIKNSSGQYTEYLEDQLGEIWMENDGQERFLRNMALVALVSRLIHTLRKMCRTAEHFSPPLSPKAKKRTNLSEFARLWLDLETRFGIDFAASADKIAFSETIREVRNQIVHDAAEANPYKPLASIRPEDGPDAALDKSFSKKYPEYVTGDGRLAEVSVSQERLETHIESAIRLVKWIADELRAKESDWLKANYNS